MEYCGAEVDGGAFAIECNDVEFAGVDDGGCTFANLGSGLEAHEWHMDKTVA